MSRVADGFLFQFNAARNANEGLEVIEDMKKYLKKRKDTMDGLLKEISRSKILIKFTSVASEGSFSTLPNTPATKITVNYTPKDFKKIVQSWDTLVEFNAVIERLEGAIIPKTESMYKNVPGLEKQLASTEKFLKECKESRDKLLNGLKATGTKQIPDPITKLINNLKKDLTTKLAGRFKTCDILVYPNVTRLKDKNVLAFFCYLQFTELVDDADWKKEIFDVVIIEVTDAKGRPQYQVQTFEGHELPPEIELRDNDWMSDVVGVENRVITRLTDIHSLNLLKPQTLNITQKYLDKNKSKLIKVPGVEKIIIEGNFFKVYLKASVTNPDTLNKASKDIFWAVKGFFNLSSKFKLTAKNPELENGQYVITFAISTPSEQNNKMSSKFALDHSVLQEMEVRLGLDKKASHMLEDSYKDYLYKQFYRIKPMPYPSSLKDILEYLEADEKAQKEEEQLPINADRTKGKPASSALVSLRNVIKKKKMSKEMEDEDVLI